MTKDPFQRKRQRYLRMRRRMAGAKAQAMRPERTLKELHRYQDCAYGTGEPHFEEHAETKHWLFTI